MRSSCATAANGPHRHARPHPHSGAPAPVNASAPCSRARWSTTGRDRHPGRRAGPQRHRRDVLLCGSTGARRGHGGDPRAGRRAGRRVRRRGGDLPLGRAPVTTCGSARPAMTSRARRTPAPSTTGRDRLQRRAVDVRRGRDPGPASTRPRRAAAWARCSRRSTAASIAGVPHEDAGNRAARAPSRCSASGAPASPAGPARGRGDRFGSAVETGRRDRRRRARRGRHGRDAGLVDDVCRVPQPRRTFRKGVRGVPGRAEAGDRFGSALAYGAGSAARRTSRSRSACPARSSGAARRRRGHSDPGRRDHALPHRELARAAASRAAPAAASATARRWDRAGLPGLDEEVRRAAGRRAVPGACSPSAAATRGLLRPPQPARRGAWLRERVRASPPRSGES